MGGQARIVEPEWLDDLPFSDPRAQASRRDLIRLNAVMRQAGLMSRLLKTACPKSAPRTILDLGSGDGLFMLRVARRLSRHWPNLTVVMLDRQARVNRETQAQFEKLGWVVEAVSADANAFLQDTRMKSVDIITANLFLHHLAGEKLRHLFALTARHTRAFASCEPRRAPLALGASRLVGALGCNAVTRHDAVASVRAGFRGKELSALWPDESGWQLVEQSAGLFTHCFAACHEDS